jgi:hypothetical protein
MNFQYLEVRPCIETYTRLADQTEEGSIDSYRSEEDYAKALEAVEKRGERYKTFWTLYGVDQEGLGFAIGDFTTKDAAHEIMNAIIAPMAAARDKIRDGEDEDRGNGSFITAAERAACDLEDFINQCSNMERI